ncbi:Minf_1886 family protein [Phycisphaera mikurensis]|uniref:Uncharacterized protein n=1 Tax=Phycisphaera mikurensis (strain NBRC 102666 / KCTC 22515 / FYK2301M01) TaxID=1142394 RepID=I0IAL9_PHYMF|nr:Minf_1886 family protein [Phycisphaera mikurensis]BAM02307.1 hypothetical protein PSMK_01480 [Phycisphaera mikurensis NBRC 102666]
MIPAELVELARSSRYPLDAFLFVQRGLDHTVRALHGDGDDATQAQDPEEDEEDTSRHVSGRQLCEGIRDFAIAQYGLLAPVVLNRWNVRRSQDFGRIVFEMVDAGLMRKTDEDNVDDFNDVFDFREAFGPEAAIAKVLPPVAG